MEHNDRSVACECAICGGMELTPEQLAERHRAFIANVEDNIARFGQQVIGVGGGGNGDELPFTYTIGNHRRGYAELLLVALNFGDAQRALNYLAEVRRSRGNEFSHGELVPLGDAAVPMKLVEVPSGVAQEGYTFQATQILGTSEYRVLQVVIPDEQGRYPGDPGCSEPYASLPDLSRVVH